MLKKIVQKGAEKANHVNMIAHFLLTHLYMSIVLAN